MIDEEPAGSGGRAGRVLRTAALRGLFVGGLAVGLIALIVYVEGEEAPPDDAPAGESRVSFAESECYFDAPLGVETECGYLRVPEDWSSEDPKRFVRLPVAIFHTPNRDPLGDPVVLLSGGPGHGPTPELDFSYEYQVAPLLANRDVVVFDQRGTGAAEPSLECWELYYSEFGEFDFEEDFLDGEFEEEVEEPEPEPLTLEETMDQQVTAVRDCQERLEGEERAGLAHYTTTNIARDVEELRSALGYDKWNLWGVSYGTKVALAVLRDYPKGVRSAVLDSAYPPEVNLYEESAANLDRALREVFRACEADSRCQLLYRDLEGSFERVMTRLGREPVDVVLDPEYDDYTVVVDEIGLLTAIHQMLYSPEATSALPEMIDSANDGDFYSAAYEVDSIGSLTSGVAYGMHLSVQCAEEMKRASQEAIDAALEEYAALRPYVAADLEFTQRACRGWPGEPDPRDDEPVVSDVPVLVLAGQFDPTTPPAWGEAAAGRMERGFFVEFPGQGHGVALSDACPFGIAEEFLAHPRAEPDVSCIEDMEFEFY